MLFHGFVFAPVKVPVLSSLSNDLRRGHGNLSAPSYQVAFDHDVPHSMKKTNPGHFLILVARIQMLKGINALSSPSAHGYF